MKTLDEVIKAMETDPVPMAYTARLSVHEDIMTDALEWLKAYKGHIELDKLRDKCEAKNDPLTWDELRSMKGKPVWMEYNLHLSERAQAVSKGWFVISSFRPLGQATEMMVMTNNFVFTDYEQVGEWQAYRKERI